MALSLPKILKKLRWTIGAYEEKSRHDQLATPPEKLDSKVIIVLIVAATILSFSDYYGSSGDWDSLRLFVTPFVDEPRAFLASIFHHAEYGRLARLSYWSGTTFLGYFIIPALIICFVFKQPLRDFGLPRPSKNIPFGLTLGLYLVMLPFLVAVAFTKSFQSTYPFYQFADRSLFDLFAWMMVYAAQFFALEFFYRGFLIHGLKHRFGVYAIFVSMIPYVMIHFGKPLPETLGSIIAGIALGAISYHYRSVWPAVSLHIAIAISMDLFSLSAQGRLLSLF